MIKFGDFYRNPDENIEYESKQNSNMAEQLNDVLEEKVVKEKLELVLGEVSVETLKKCERRPGLRGNIKKVIRFRCVFLLLL